MKNSDYRLLITDYRFPPHVVQSPEWGEFKTKMGTEAVRAGEVQFTLHKIPFTSLNIGYCPKVDPEKIDWPALKKAGERHNCVMVRFDVPNVVSTEHRAPRKNRSAIQRGGQSVEQELRKHCRKAARDTFAKQTILLDLTKSEKELMENMKSKTRYNLRLAQKHGVQIREGGSAEDLETFLKLQRENANRQGFYIHPDKYYRTMWEVLRPKKLVHLLIAEFEGEPLVAWMLFTYKDVLYYPYGGSSLKHREKMPSNLICWEAIRLGKRLGCKIFDMWGATDDKSDPWYGFTRFKLGYGGKLVTFIDSYDLVLKPIPYYLFNFTDTLRWRYLELKASTG